MKKFWFKLEKIPRPTAINLGCGITAADRRDADNVFRERVQSRLPGARILQVEEVTSVSDLEAKHVRPNVGDMDVRGVWFPQGY